VFANITEAQYPQSLADMLSKFKIARKECAETESWLKFLYNTKAIDEATFKTYRNLCGRIQRMLTELEDTLFDENIEAKLQEKASEIEASLNAAKDGFFAEFERAHAEDIAAIEETLLAKKQQLKSEIEAEK